MDPLVAASVAAILVMGIIFVLAKLSAGSPDYKGRMARFVGGESAATPKGEKEKKSFSLGIGESLLAAKVEKSVGQQGFGRKVQRKMAQADLKLTLFEYMLIKAISVVVGLIVCLFLGRNNIIEQMIFGVVGAVIGFFGLDWYIKFRIGKRLKAFNSQLSDTIALMANSLRSGYSLLQSMELVSREALDPIGVEFRRVVREVGLGLSAQDALNNLMRRLPSDDLDLLITAINIQYEVGGNLAQILDTIAHTIRERVRIKGEISVLTAQGRMSGYLITALPGLIGVVVTIINPTYMSTLWEWPWLMMPICGGILVLAGFLVIRKIVNIEV
ncbi:MAG: type II secretion system F family protein [Chloroflexota bacterium]|nr:type II secretion system F family protein [Chloroflexota bacterium]